MNQPCKRTGEIVTIDKQVGGKNQNAFYRSLFVIDGKRFLVDIAVDSVERQSSASIAHWDNGGWQQIYALHPSEMDLDFKMGYRSTPVCDDDFEAVVFRLLRVADEVCFGSPSDN